MRLLYISDDAYSFFKKLEVKLPKFAWNTIYKPFPTFFLKNAQLNKMLENSRMGTISSKYKMDSDAVKSKISIVYPSNRLTKQFIIANAVVLPNGAIINNRQILQQSSIFSKFSFSDYIETCNLFFIEKKPILTEAVFFPRLINRRGTYGDYFAEFLVPFAEHKVSKKLPILFDADFTFKSASSDLPKFGYSNLIKIPRTGLIIKKLQVNFPSHYFDNFLHHNIDLLRNVFTISSKKNSPLRVYISRLGYKADPNNRNQRELINESEVESFLQKRGYFILRSHEVTNMDIRVLLRNAQIIVFTHGSGFVHSAWSSVRSVVEIGLSNWWNPFFLKLCNGMGVENYTLLMADNGIMPINKLRAAIESAENNAVLN